MTPYYDDGTVTIYHGDCREILPDLAAGSVHLVATDPPYFRVIDDAWDDQWGPDVDAFLVWIGEALDEFRRVLVDRGTLAIFASPDMACGVEVEVRRRFAMLNHIVWRKPQLSTSGRVNPDILRRFLPASERIILAEQCRNPDGDLFRFRDHVNHRVAADVYADLIARLTVWRDAANLTNREIDQALGKNGMAGHYFGTSQWMLPTEEAWQTLSALMRDRNVTVPPWAELRQEFDARRQEFDARRREFDATPSQLELRTDVWTFPTVTGRNRHDHPTQKPVPLMLHIVGSTTRADDVVLDAFAGTGTTLRAAKDLGRKAIGIELEERYCEIAAKRLAQEVLPL